MSAPRERWPTTAGYLAVGALLLATVIAASPADAEAPRLDVTPVRSDTVRVAPPTGERGADRASILAALEEVEPGGTVQFAAGRYLVGEVVRIPTPRLTLLGHPDGTTLRGCDPDGFEQSEREIASARSARDAVAAKAAWIRCGLLELTGGSVTVRGCTFEFSRLGLLLGCCHLDRRFERSAGGYVIEGNTFRESHNGIRPWTTGPSTIRGNRFVNTFHAISGAGSHLHVLDNDISAPEPGRVPGIGHVSFAVAMSSIPARAAKALGLDDNGVGVVVAGNRIDGHPDGISLAALSGTSVRNSEIRDNTVRVDRVPIPPSGARPYIVDVTDESDSTIVGIPVSLSPRSFPGASDGGTGEGRFEDNVIAGNRLIGTEGVAIAIRRGSGNRIAGNTITRVQHRDPFPGNTVLSWSELWRQANGSGIWLSPGSDDNEIVGNTLEDIEGPAVFLEGDDNRVELRSADDAVRDLGSGNEVVRADSARSAASAGTVRVPRPTGAAGARFPPAEPEEVGMSSDAVSDLADLVRGWTRDTLIVGAEILVVKDGRAVLHEAMGWSDLEAGEPMRKNSIFRLLALTKPFTGTAALMLVEEGRLELDAPIARWIPSWANERSGAVTVRQLLTHTAGWEQYGTPRPLESYPSLRAMVDDVGRHGPQHPPGRAYRYSDVHSFALGALVAEVSGVPVERFLEERILRPLGLDDTHTRFTPDTAWASRVASRYRLDDGGAWEKVWGPDRPRADPFFRASGGLFSTAMDYARWLDAWMAWADPASGASDEQPETGRRGAAVGGSASPTAGATPDGPETSEAAPPEEDPSTVPRLLSERMAREALTPHRGPDGFHWEILSDDPLVFGHGGVDGTHAMAIPSRDAIVVYLTQSQGREMRGRWISAALDAVAPDLELRPPLASVPAEEAGLDVVELTPSERAAYAGRYGSDGGWLRIFEEDGRLRWHLPSAGSPKVTLVPLGDHLFATGRYEAGELAEVVLPLQRLRFVVEDGRATALELIHDGEVRVVLPSSDHGTIR